MYFSKGSSRWYITFNERAYRSTRIDKRIFSAYDWIICLPWLLKIIQPRRINPVYRIIPHIGIGIEPPYGFLWKPYFAAYMTTGTKLNLFLGVETICKNIVGF